MSHSSHFAPLLLTLDTLCILSSSSFFFFYLFAVSPCHSSRGLHEPKSPAALFLSSLTAAMVPRHYSLYGWMHGWESRFVIFFLRLTPSPPLYSSLCCRISTGKECNVSLISSFPPLYPSLYLPVSTDYGVVWKEEMLPGFALHPPSLPSKALPPSIWSRHHFVPSFDSPLLLRHLALQLLLTVTAREHISKRRVQIKTKLSMALHPVFSPAGVTSTT